MSKKIKYRPLIKILVLVDIIAIIILLLTGTTDRQPDYTISSIDDMMEFAELVTGGVDFEGQLVVLDVDLDLLDQPLPVIGETGSDCYFQGTFDGRGHTISNLNRKVCDGDNSLFGTLGGTVMNLGIDSGDIKGVCCGAIASHAEDEDARIINCYNRATVYGWQTGGLVGSFNGSIYNCWSDADLESKGELGSIAYDESRCMNSFAFRAEYRDETSTSGGVQRYWVDNQYFMSLSDITLPISAELNRGVEDVGVYFPDIRSEDLYTWTTTWDGQTVKFDRTTGRSGLKAHIRAKMRNAYPCSAIMLGMLMPLLVLAATGGVGKMQLQADTKKR